MTFKTIDYSTVGLYGKWGKAYGETSEYLGPEEDGVDPLLVENKRVERPLHTPKGNPKPQTET